MTIFKNFLSMNNFLPADWRLGYNTAAPYGIYDS